MQAKLPCCHKSKKTAGKPPTAAKEMRKKMTIAFTIAATNTSMNSSRNYQQNAWRTSRVQITTSRFVFKLALRNIGVTLTKDFLIRSLSVLPFLPVITCRRGVSLTTVHHHHLLADLP
ncbi:hypothetical protein E3N88_21753 [Mikania micrantha]|uniref:Uncharacterized protein n=1 Tax=Mikania micrantha TaxID=192012 RepID=A0A5N6N8F1_9ASTR|nr:hypothetical protein E3N88_21753 [Mikania micrantha]